MKNFAFALLHPSRAAHVAHRCAVHQLVARGKFKIVRWQFSFFLKNRFHWGNIAEAHVALARDVLKLHLACSRENAHARASEFSLFFFLSFFLIFFLLQDAPPLYPDCKSVFKPNVPLKFNLASGFRARACSRDARRFMSCIKNEWHYLFFFPPSLSEKVLPAKNGGGEKEE